MPHFEPSQRVCNFLQPFSWPNNVLDVYNSIQIFLNLVSVTTLLEKSKIWKTFSAIKNLIEDISCDLSLFTEPSTFHNYAHFENMEDDRPYEIPYDAE